MAKRYTVKPTDNLLELSKKFGSSPSNILKANGIKSLTPGQTLVINTGAGTNDTSTLNAPKTHGGFLPSLVPIRNTIMIGGSLSGDKQGQVRSVATNPFSSSFLSNTYVQPYTTQPSIYQYGIPTGADTAGSLSPDKQYQIQASGLIGGDKQGIYSPVRTSGGLPPDERGVLPNVVTPQVSTPVVSRVEAKAQFLSGNGLNPRSNYIPTRSDVWNMKANARRRDAERNYDDGQTDGSGYIADAPVVVAPPPMLENQGNFVNNAVSWRVG